MTRSRLRNHFLQNRSEENQKLFCKQRNKCVSLLRKSKKYYFANLNEKNLADNKHFWKTVKPFLSKKNHLPERINLTEGENNSLLTNCGRSCKRINWITSLQMLLKISIFQIWTLRFFGRKHRWSYSKGYC